MKQPPLKAPASRGAWELSHWHLLCLVRRLLLSLTGLPDATEQIQWAERTWVQLTCITGEEQQTHSMTHHGGVRPDPTGESTRKGTGPSPRALTQSNKKWPVAYLAFAI